MSAELGQLRRDVQALAKKFRDAGHSDLADQLMIDGQSLGVKAKIAADRGLKTFVPQATEQQKIAEQPPRVDLRQQMYELLPHLVEPTDAEKEALRVKKGLVFLPMVRKSYAKVVKSAESHFWNKELEYANSRAALRDFVPPVSVEVGLIEGELALPDSFRKSRATALEMIYGYSQKLATEFPDFRAIALPSTGYASADLEYSKRNRGQVLFKNYFAWCLDNLSGVSAARAGRLDPMGRFLVDVWHADGGDGDVRAVPAVVKVDSRYLAPR